MAKNIAIRQEIGNKGEDLACEYLENIGYEVIARNWRVGHLELDIIAEYKNAVHIVEVRTLSYPAIHQPFETINLAKQRKIIKAASIFAAKERVRNEIIFDVVSIILKTDSYKLEHIKDAFSPLW